MSRTVTLHGQPYTVEQEGHVRFLLSLTKRGRKGESLAQWGIVQPITHFPEFAASGRVEDLLPLSLVERVEDPLAWNCTRTNTWPLEFGVALIHQGELQLHYTYSVAASKSWPLERCLIGLGWEQILG